MKQSAAQARATQKWEKNNYYKVMLRIPKAEEETIKAAAGDSINRFILDAVHDAIRRQNARQDAPGDAETRAKIADYTETQDRAQDAESAREAMKWYGFPADMVAEMEKYGDPAEMFFQGALAIMEEYRAGLR